MNINDIEFNPKASDEEIECARKWLLGNEKKFQATSNYCVFGERVAPFIGMPCHRNISSPGTTNRSVVATEIGLNRRNAQVLEGRTYRDWPQKMSWETAKPFFEWWLYESYFGRFILNRNDLEFCRDHGVIVSADTPACILQNIMITSRHFYEVGNQAFKMFADLRARGIDPRIAYMMCFNSVWGHFGTKETQAVRSGSAHRAHPLLNLDALENFLLGEVRGGYLVDAGHTLRDPAGHYRTNHNYRGGFSLFHEHKPGLDYFDPKDYLHFVYQLMEMEDFRNELSEHRKEKQGPKLYRPPNPFDRSRTRDDPPASNEVSYTEFFDFVGPWVQRYFEKKGIL